MIVKIVPLVQPEPSQIMFTPLNKKITAIAKITTEKMKYMYEGIHNLLSISVIFAILYIMCGFLLFTWLFFYEYYLPLKNIIYH